MRKSVLSLVAGMALAFGATAANAAISIGTSGSSTGSNIIVGNLDNSSTPETFTFDTFVTDLGANSPYTSYFDFSNDLVGNYTFSIITSVRNATITLAEVLDNGTLSTVASTSGSSNSLTLNTANLTANASYRFTYQSDVPSNGKVSGNASFYVAPVPEPATWALMLLGFGGMGFAMRRRQKPALAQLA